MRESILKKTNLLLTDIIKNDFHFQTKISSLLAEAILLLPAH